MDFSLCERALGLSYHRVHYTDSCMREPSIKFQPKSEDFFCNNKGWVIMEIFVVLNILLPLASLINSGIFEKKHSFFCDGE